LLGVVEDKISHLYVYFVEVYPGLTRMYILLLLGCTHLVVCILSFFSLVQPVLADHCPGWHTINYCLTFFILSLVWVGLTFLDSL
jgi:hypothetical protein